MYVKINVPLFGISQINSGIETIEIADNLLLDNLEVSSEIDHITL
jgi:hypothetical protein